MQEIMSIALPQLSALEVLWSEPNLDDLNRLARKLDCPVTFCDLQAKSAQEYEWCIFNRSQVPTRIDTWHDRFNAAMWLLWPQTKLALNQAHIKDLMQANAAQNRSRRRDTLTLIDEVGLVLLSSDSSWSELNKQHQWQEMFWHRRQAWQASVAPLLIGHGLAEQLLNPHIGLTAKAIHLQIDDIPLAQDLVQALADRILAEKVRSEFADPSALAPLPVLGIPGWHPSQSADFYQDTSYFRPLRQR